MTETRVIVYPNIHCDDHPDVYEPGYMICSHVKTLADIGYLERPDKNLGVIACAECQQRINDPKYVVEHFRCSCALCLKENGLLGEVQ
jgi:hypothetical protein